MTDALSRLTKNSIVTTNLHQQRSGHVRCSVRASTRSAPVQLVQTCGPAFAHVGCPRVREEVDPLFDAEAGSPHLALEHPIDLLIVCRRRPVCRLHRAHNSWIARPRGSNKPLPQIDGQLVADCKAQNPNFGQRTTLPSQATEPSARVSPLPQAASPQLAPAGQRNGPPSESVEPPMQAVPPQPPATPQWPPCRRLVTVASAKSK